MNADALEFFVCRAALRMIEDGSTDAKSLAEAFAGTAATLMRTTEMSDMEIAEHFVALAYSTEAGRYEYAN
jgi:hypothetical protein